MKIFFTKEKAWSVDVTIAGRRVRESNFGKKKEAEEFVAELRVKAKRAKFLLADEERPRITLQELVDERILDTAKQASGRQTKKILESFAAMFPAGFLIDEVKAGHIREWSRPLKRRGLKGETINRYLNVVSAMFRAAPQLFLGLEEEWHGPKVTREKVSRRGRERVIASDEAQALLQALRFPGARKGGGAYRPQIVFARREVADCFELALNTGMRGKEVRCLEWSQVELAENEVHLPGSKTKTGEPRDVLLNKRAVEILRRRFDTRTSRFVFPNPSGVRPRTEICNVLRPVARRLGLRYGRNLADGFSPHDARHTVTTNMLRRGHDMKTVQDVLGHTDRTMTLRYSHSTRASRRAAIEAVGDPEANMENRGTADKQTG